MTPHLPPAHTPPETVSRGAILSPLIHLIDDDEAVRSSLALLISTVGLRVESWSDPQAFMRSFDRQSVGAIVLDVRMPGISGLTVLDLLKAQGVDQPVIMLTGHGTVEMCRRAFKSGAAEFWKSPFMTSNCSKPCKTRCASMSNRASGTRSTARPANAMPSCPSASAKCLA